MKSHKYDVVNPLESLHNTIVFGARDWSACKRDAWIYGIVVGWGNVVTGEYNNGVIEELQNRFRWTDEDVERLKKLHEIYVNMSKALEISNDMAIEISDKLNQKEKTDE
jgi:hypothetical protein